MRKESSFKSVKYHQQSVIVVVYLWFHENYVFKFISQIVQHFKPWNYWRKLSFHSFNDWM